MKQDYRNKQQWQFSEQELKRPAKPVQAKKKPWMAYGIVFLIIIVTATWLGWHFYRTHQRELHGATHKTSTTISIPLSLPATKVAS